MISVRHQEILSTLEGLDPWLQKLGIEPKHDRIHQAIEIVRKAEEGRHRTRTTGEPSVIGNVSTYYFGVTEAFEFYEIFRAFEREEPRILRPKLERALSGTLRPEDEKAENADARNMMFELALAAGWRLLGLDVTIGEPDVTLRLDGVPFLVECKRPFREESIRANVRGAVEQLEEHLAAAEGSQATGIIAISVSRVFNPGDKIFVAPTENSREKLGDLLEKKMREHELDWVRSELHPRIVAVLFHVSTPGVVEDKDMLTLMTYSALMPAKKEGPSFGLLKEKLLPLFGH